MKNYLIYRCKICNKNFILPKNEVELNKEQGNYLTCPFKGHKNIIVTGAYDSIKECMDHISFVRDKGRIKQKG